MKPVRRMLLAAAILGLAVRVSAQVREPAVPSAAEAKAQTDKLAQTLANPVANLWSLTFQFGHGHDLRLAGRGARAPGSAGTSRPSG